MSAMTLRFRAVARPQGWTVLDTKTDRPAEIGGDLQERLTEGDAIASAAGLNGMVEFAARAKARQSSKASTTRAGN